MWNPQTFGRCRSRLGLRQPLLNLWVSISEFIMFICCTMLLKMHVFHFQMWKLMPQPSLTSRMLIGHISGNNYAKVSLLFKFMNVDMVNKTTTSKITAALTMLWSRVSHTIHNPNECVQCNVARLLWLLWALIISADYNWNEILWDFKMREWACYSEIMIRIVSNE